MSDLVDGFLRMMALEEDPGPVNLGNPSERTIRDLAEISIRLTDSRSELVNRPLPVDDPTRRCPNIDRAKRLLEWEPRVTIEEGMGKTIDYFRTIVAEQG